MVLHRPVGLACVYRTLGPGTPFVGFRLCSVCVLVLKATPQAVPSALVATAPQVNYGRAGLGGIVWL